MTENPKVVEDVESGVTVEFWGVRGSLPTPGPDTVRYGGNTSCVSLAFGTGEHLILDAGTGIRRLGEALSVEDGDLFILISHRHWDHIQGFPFFAPLYQENRRIYMFPVAKGRELFCSLIERGRLLAACEGICHAMYRRSRGSCP